MRTASTLLLFLSMGIAGAPLGAADDSPLVKTSERGPVTLKVSLSPESPVIGDTITLTIEVRAEADVEVLMPEFGEALDRFDILDFVPTKEHIDNAGNTVSEQRYTLQPMLSGKQNIPPILVEFVDHRADHKLAPEGEDAYELLSERIDFAVESVIPEGAAAQLKPVLGELQPIPEPTAPRWPYGVGFLIALALASPFLLKLFHHWRRLARRRSAYEIAHSQLERLLASVPVGATANAAQLDAFFVRLSGIVRSYIENRFELRAPDFTTEEFLDAVGESPDFSDSHRRLLREFLNQADLVKFAHMLPAQDDIEHSVTLARKFLDDTREHAPMIDEESSSDAPVEKEVAGV